MAKILTTSSIEKMKPDPDKRIEVPDPALTGLYITLHPSGTKSWVLRYRFAGKPKKLTLGKWPTVGLADARAAAAEAIGLIERGNDPAAQKMAKKAAKQESELSERDKIRTLVDQFEKRHLRKLKSGTAVRQSLDLHVIPKWGERHIQNITRRDVIDLMDGLVDSGKATTANRVRVYLSKFFGWCVEREIVAHSPITGVKPVAKERTRERVLTDEEIRWFWKACDAAEYPFGAMSKLLLLTGQRLNEVARIADNEINGDLWHLIAERTKNSRAHDVPLSSAAQRILNAVARMKNSSGHIFTTNARTPVSGFYKGRNSLAKHMKSIAENERGKSVDIPHWTFHDLRRTAATGMARLGVPVRVTEAVLNHVSGTGGGIVAIYQRHDYASEKAEALEKWSQFVMNLIDMDNLPPQSGFILPHRRAIRLDDAWAEHYNS